MTASNIKLKVSKDLLEIVYTKLNDGTFRILEDVLYDMQWKDKLAIYLKEYLFLIVYTLNL